MSSSNDFGSFFIDEILHVDQKNVNSGMYSLLTSFWLGAAVGALLYVEVLGRFKISDHMQ